MVIDVRSGPYPAAVPWYVDLAGPIGMPGQTNQVRYSSCTDSQKNPVLNFDFNLHEIAMGGRFAAKFYKCPVNSLGLIAIGTKRVPEMWNGAELPHYVPWTPMCLWATDTLFLIGFATDAQGWGNAPPVPIPYDWRLFGFKFCVQPAFADPKANVLGWFTSTSMCFEIVYAPSAAQLENIGPPVPDWGHLKVGWGVITRLSQ